MARLLFGVKIERTRRISWDFTTLVLRRHLLRWVRPGQRVLEVGTGPHAILSVFLAKRRQLCLTACDINAVYVASATESACRNRVRITVLESDLFERLEGRFDVIFFNSVYIPQSVGERLGLDRSHRWASDWRGGDKGTETIARFLDQCHARLAAGGTALLGFNAIYLQENEVATLCQHCGYRIAGRGRALLNPSRVLVLQRRVEP